MFDDEETIPEPRRVYFNGDCDVAVFERFDETVGGNVLVFRTEFGERFTPVYPADWPKLSQGVLERISSLIRG